MPDVVPSIFPFKRSKTEESERTKRARKKEEHLQSKSFPDVLLIDSQECINEIEIQSDGNVVEANMDESIGSEELHEESQASEALRESMN